MKKEGIASRSKNTAAQAEFTHAPCSNVFILSGCKFQRETV